MSQNDKDLELDGELDTLNPTQAKRPKKYNVVLHNDDYTTMDFVIFVLKTFFHKKEREAQEIMMNIHKKGQGVGGTYSYEIAETKVKQVTQSAKENSHPLKCTMEEE